MRQVWPIEWVIYAMKKGKMARSKAPEERGRAELASLVHRARLGKEQFKRYDERQMIRS